MDQSYRVVLTPNAEKGVEEIVRYLAQEVSYETADRVRRGIEETIEGLSIMPERHTIIPSISDEKIIYRRVLKWSYRIIYTVSEADIMVLVVDIAHAARDPKRIEDLFG